MSPTLPEATFPQPWTGGGPAPAPQDSPPPSTRWDGRRTALILAAVLGLTGVGAVAAAAATPGGITAPGSGPGVGQGVGPGGGRGFGPGGGGQQVGPRQGGRGGFQPGGQGGSGMPGGSRQQGAPDLPPGS